MWYNSLNQITNVGSMVQGINVAIHEANTGKCLSIVYSKNTTQPSTLKSMSCDEKGMTICKIGDVDEAVPGQPLPSFPCLSQISSRKKRDAPTPGEQKLTAGKPPNLQN